MPKFGNYVCPCCDFLLREYPVDFGTTFPQGAPFCPICKNVDDAADALVKMEWIPQLGRVSAGNGPTFTAFETTGPDGKLARINSITELRAMERRSEQMARNGEGQQMVWRDFSNGKSNKDAHAIHNKWEADDYPGIPGKAQREALRTLTQEQGEAKLVELKKNAAEISAAYAPPAETT